MSHKICFFRANPQAVARKFGGPQAEVNVGSKLDQPICVAEDSGDGRPVWAVLIPAAWETAARARPQFLGIGLNEVKANHPAIYALVAEKLVEMDDPQRPGMRMRIRRAMGDAIVVGETVVQGDLPSLTFAGYDPMTGGPA